MGRNVWMYFVSTASTYIALNALVIVSTVSTYIVFEATVYRGEQSFHTSLEFFLNVAELSMNSDKSLKHELGSI